MKTTNFIDILIFKVRSNLVVEVSRYYLNFLWWIIDPVLYMLVYYFVFSIMLHQGTRHFTGFILIGQISWNWFARSISNASSSIINNSQLIQQVYIPKVFFPLEVVFQDSFKQCIVFILLLVFLIFYPAPKSMTWFALPMVIIVQIMFIAAYSTICAALIPFVPDLRFIINTALILIMFISGVFYDIDTALLPHHRDILLLIDPMAGLMQCYRQILLHASWPNWNYLGYVALHSLVVGRFACLIINRFDKYYPRISLQ